MQLSTAHAFTLDVLVGPPVEVGTTPLGFRRVIPILGGTVGDGLDGTVLPGGADWNVVRADGSTELWARYELRLADGAVVSVLNTAVHAEHAEPPILTSPRFEVGSDGPQWLGTGVFVGALFPDLAAGGVRIEVHRIEVDGVTGPGRRPSQR